MNLHDAVFTDHAREQLAARAIDEAACRAVLANPQAVHPVRRGRVVAQAVLPFTGRSGQYMLRVFVDVNRKPPEVVTAYRTSKIDKYRSRP